ncbi:MAG: alpha/beta hydrolase [Bacteroidia bacterium]|nr:alpha/beta hydrolase [Bacteroidia bacterium]
MDLEIKKEGKFEYIEEGKGPVLLLLHGLFGALSNWEHVIEQFSSNYKVVIPILPLYKIPIYQLSVRSLAKFTHRFINHKGFNTVTLLGNSLGGHVALVYITEHSERVHSMMLTGSSGLYENAFGGTFPKRNDYDFIKSRVEYTFYDPKSASKELVDEVFDIVTNRVKAIRVLKFAKSAIKHNMREDLPSIKVPVCLIWGKNDNITPPAVAEEFHKLMPHSELHWINKCGHAAMMENPQKFNKILDDWLSRLF